MSYKIDKLWLGSMGVLLGSVALETWADKRLEKNQKATTRQPVAADEDTSWMLDESPLGDNEFDTMAQELKRKGF